MAGVVPTRKSASGRKQWTIRGNSLLLLIISTNRDPLSENITRVFVLDGPSSTVKQLRSQMASEGCPESQVVLAKQLLEDQSGKLQRSNAIFSC